MKKYFKIKKRISNIQLKNQDSYKKDFNKGTTMSSKKITKTWWGEKWLDSLKGVYLTNRIGRGKTYANTGRVYDILINDNLALAKVRGNYKSFYNVSVEFRQFSQSEKKHNHQNNL